jgi:hypothetical protein
MKKEKICAYCHKEIKEKEGYNVNEDETSCICQICVDTITCECALTNVLSWYKHPEKFSFIFKTDKKHTYRTSVKQIDNKEWKHKYKRS